MPKQSSHCGVILRLADRPRHLTRTAVRKQVARLMRKWAPRMALDQWAITVNWDDDLDVEADCYARPRYEEATITFNIWLIQQISARTDELEELVVHEMAHCIAWPSSEAVVSRIARALIRTERLSTFSSKRR